MNVFHTSPLIQQNPNFKGIMMLKGILFHFKSKEKLASGLEAGQKNLNSSLCSHPGLIIGSGFACFTMSHGHFTLHLPVSHSF